MTIDRTIELLKIERECVHRAETCTRQCERCPLVQDTGDLLEAYDDAIMWLKAIHALRK